MNSIQKPVILVAAKGFWCLRKLVDNEVFKQISEWAYSLDLKTEKEISERVTVLVLADQLCNAAVMERFPKLRIVARTGTGYDNVDISEAKKRGIIVTRVAEVNAGPASDFALMLVLALSRNILLLHGKMIEGEWQRLPGKVLPEMTIGVVGLGAIGRSLVKKLHALGTKRIVGWNRSRKREILRLMDRCKLELLDLSELMSESDAVIIALALTPETEKLIGHNLISLMKPNAYFVNVSRGAVVDEDFLAEVAAVGKIGGVGLDVFSSEPPDENPFSQPFMVKLINASQRGRNIILSPHNAYFTQNSVQNVSLQLAKNIKAILEKKLKGVEII